MPDDDLRKKIENSSYLNNGVFLRYNTKIHNCTCFLRLKVGDVYFRACSSGTEVVTTCNTRANVTLLTPLLVLLVFIPIVIHTHFLP